MWRAKHTATNAVGVVLEKPRGKDQGDRLMEVAVCFLLRLGSWNIQTQVPRLPKTYCVPVETIFCSFLLQDIFLK